MGGPASPHGGRATEAQGPSVPHHPRLVDGDRVPCTSDQHVGQESRQESQDDDVDRAPCTTNQQEEQKSRQGPQDEARPAPRRRNSFKTSSEPSRSAERVLPSKTTERPRSVDGVPRVTNQALGIAALTPHSCPLPSKPPGRPRFAERVPSQPVDPAASALDQSTSDKPGRSALHATRLRSTPSVLPASGPAR